MKTYIGLRFSANQLLCCVQLSATPWTTALQASLSIASSRVYSDLCPLSWWSHLTISSSVFPLLLLPSILPSIRIFSIESVLWSSGQSIAVSASISVLPMNIQDWGNHFRIDWMDPPAVQGTLKGLLQSHTSKASILWCSAFFIVQFFTSIHDYWENHTFD